MKTNIRIKTIGLVNKILNKMDEKENDINDKIQIKQKEIEVEDDFNKKHELQRELQILTMRKEIEKTKEKLNNKKL
ncbi:hypothetical protein RXV94_03480 [Yeosuana sp. MJ-SS3]|uniref:Uncharacterized protein n=1 Tax=Gilvirhabdus luticola TaxID=3079858 RepID=A0ABU3U4G3_9FLAO|nr:hypothetical protein [Yeosuana sp. MJ-SS3]MDU8885207.1 hypothetical protein [Yeosuana sp. MJ-SS3]